MRSGLLLFVACTFMAACSPAKPIQSIGQSGYNYDGEYRALPVPKRLWSNPLDIVNDFVGRYSEDPDANPKVEIRMSMQADETYNLLITAIGYQDDSVRGEQWRIRLNRVGESFGVKTAETRAMCWRGASAGKWVTEPCL